MSGSAARRASLRRRCLTPAAAARMQVRWWRNEDPLPARVPRNCWYPTWDSRNAARLASEAVEAMGVPEKLRAYDLALLNACWPLIKHANVMEPWVLVCDAKYIDKGVKELALVHLSRCFGTEYFNTPYLSFAASGGRRRLATREVFRDGQILTLVLPDVLQIDEPTQEAITTQLREVLDEMLPLINHPNDKRLGETESDCFARGELDEGVPLKMQSAVMGKNVDTGKVFGFCRTNSSAPWFAEFLSEETARKECEESEFFAEDPEEMQDDNQPPPPPQPPPAAAAPAPTDRKHKEKKQPKGSKSVGAALMALVAKRKAEEHPRTAPSPPTPQQRDESAHGSTSEEPSAKRSRALAPLPLRSFALVETPEGKLAEPIALVAHEGESSHYFATQDLITYQPFVTAYCRAQGMSEETIHDIINKAPVSIDALYLEPVLKRRSSDGMHVPVQPLCAFVRQGSANSGPPRLVQGEELTKHYLHHMASILRLQGVKEAEVKALLYNTK